MSEQDRIRIDVFVESRDFYELMQRYRHAPRMPQEDVIEAFERVKRSIIMAVENTYAYRFTGE